MTETQTVDVKRFTCPRCGSHYWGTSGCGGSLEDATGHCHGPVGCTFSWPRSEDAKYMEVIGTEKMPVVLTGVVP